MVGFARAFGDGAPNICRVLIYVFLRPYTGPGDVVGVLIQIPPLLPSEQADLESRRWDNTCDYKSYAAYHAEAPENMTVDEEKQEELKNGVFPKVKDSRIAYFKNGVEVGVAFENLYLGV